jgi:hypothetical protein
MALQNLHHQIRKESLQSKPQFAHGQVESNGILQTMHASQLHNELNGFFRLIIDE